MNDLTSDSFADAFRELREAFGVLIQIEKTEITAVVDELDAGRELMDGGFAEEGDVEARALKADLPKVPLIGKQCHYSGRVYRIATVRERDNAQVIQMRLRPAKR